MYHNNMHSDDYPIKDGDLPLREFLVGMWNSARFRKIPHHVTTASRVKQEESYWSMRPAISVHWLQYEYTYSTWLVIFVPTYFYGAGSIPDGIGIFHGHNPSGRTMALGSTQPVTGMSTRNISLGLKASGT